MKPEVCHTSGRLRSSEARGEAPGVGREADRADPLVRPQNQTKATDRLTNLHGKNVSSVSRLRPETLFPAGNIRKFRLRNIGKHWETFSYWKHSSSAPWTTLGRPQTTPDDLGRTERTTWTTWTTLAGRQRCVAAHSQKNGWASILEEIPMAHW